MAVCNISSGLTIPPLRGHFFMGLVICTGCLIASVQAQSSGTVTKPLEPFISRMSWIQFEIVNGRIQGRFIRRMQSRTLSLYHQELDAEEHATVRTRGGSFSLKYTLMAPAEHIQVQYDTDGLLQMVYESREAQDGSYMVEIRQQGQSDVEIRIIQSDVTTIYGSSKIWLAMLKMPEAHRIRFIRVLQRLSPHLHLELRFKDVLGRLSRIALSPVATDCERIRSLIVQLNSESFSERQLADRQLREFGRPLVGFLAGLDYSTLSAEQRTRLKRISANLISIDPDTTEQVVSCLRMDPTAWLVLSKCNDPILARGAIAQIEQLTGRKLGLDQRDQNARDRLTAVDVQIRLR